MNIFDSTCSFKIFILPSFSSIHLLAKSKNLSQYNSKVIPSLEKSTVSLRKCPLAVNIECKHKNSSLTLTSSFKAFCLK